MRIRLTIASLSAAVSLVGAAHAQEGAAGSAAAPAWYDRFTYSSGLAGDRTGWTESEANAALAWQPSAKWGVTLRMRERETAPIVGAQPAQDETALRAYYQFTPRLRVGGEVSVMTDQKKLELDDPAIRAAEPQAGVRLESAFKF